MAFQFRHFRQILDDILSYIVGHSPVTDINPGSIVRTFSEAVSLEIALIYVTLQSILNLFSIDKASGEDLDERAADFGETRRQPEQAVGFVVVGDSTLDATDTASSTLAAVLTSGVSTQATIQSADYADFPATGSIIVDRGNGLRELIEYTSKTGPDKLNLATTPVSSHALAATVYLSTVGADRTIAAGTIVKTAAPDELKVITTIAVTLLDGEYAVSGVPVRSLETGSANNVSSGRLNQFEVAPFPTATVTNPEALKGGRDLETDPEFRARIKEKQQALSSSTPLRIQTEALKVQLDSGQRVITAKVIEPVSPGVSTLYINDGTSTYSPSTVGVLENEVIVSIAEDGQRRMELENWPIVNNLENLYASIERGESTGATSTTITDSTKSWSASAGATGNITVVAGSSLVDGETFTLIDSRGITTVFEFNSTGGVTAGRVAVAFTGGDSAAVVKAAVIAAINGLDPLTQAQITASDGGGSVVSLVQDIHGTSGNTTISETVANGSFAKTNFTGGGNGTLAQKTVKDENDNFFFIQKNTSTVMTVQSFTGEVPVSGSYAVFNFAADYPTGSHLVKDTDYTINNTNGQFELDLSSFPNGLEPNDSVIAYYDGVDAAYVHYDGLLQEVQKVINGDPDDIENYPGVKAAGSQVNITAPNVVTVTVSGNVAVNEGFGEPAIRALVRSAIVDYVNSLSIGDDVIWANIVKIAMSVPGVLDFNLTAPSGNVVVTDTQLAKTTLGDVTVT